MLNRPYLLFMPDIQKKLTKALKDQGVVCLAAADSDDITALVMVAFPILGQEQPEQYAVWSFNKTSGELYEGSYFRGAKGDAYEDKVARHKAWRKFIERLTMKIEL